MKLRWTFDNPEPGGVPRNGTFTTVQNFPGAGQLTDVDADDSWNDANGVSHRGTPVGRALPFDNGDGCKWEAIVYTNEDNLLEPPQKPTAPGSTPTSYGHFDYLDWCKTEVEKQVALIYAAPAPKAEEKKK